MFAHVQVALLLALADKLVLGIIIEKFNPIQKLLRWKTSQESLFRQLEKLEADNLRLRSKVTTLQKAKELAERQAEERRREKESLRARLSEQKKATESAELVTTQLGTKIAELREEIEKLRQKKKASGKS